MKKLSFIMLCLTSCASQKPTVFYCSSYNEGQVDVCNRITLDQINEICEKAHNNILGGIEIGMPEFCEE
jgi:hypothetical protein